MTRAMLAEEIARRTGTDVDRDLYPSLAAAAVVSAVRTALDHWLLSADPAESLPQVIDQALAQLAHGLSPPNESPRPRP